MKKGILNCIITILLIAVFVQYAGHIVRPLDTDVPVAYINSFHNMPEQIVEVIGFGSSHMWRGLDPSVMYKEFGIGAYNYGCNWQKCNTTSLFIQDALRTQSPKVILIEAYVLSVMLGDQDVNGEIYYTRAIPEFEGKQRYLKQCFGNDIERWLSYYVPLCAFHDNWVNISESSFHHISDGVSLHNKLGFMPGSVSTQISISDPKDMPQEELSADAFNEIAHMIQVCRENDVEIVFYVAPYSGEYNYADAMAEIAEDYGYPFLNLFEEIDEVGLDGSVDFSDAGHLNTSGAQKVARYLSKFLKENYELTDMREVKDNFWEQNLAS